MGFISNSGSFWLLLTLNKDQLGSACLPQQQSLRGPNGPSAAGEQPQCCKQQFPGDWESSVIPWRMHRAHRQPWSAPKVSMDLVDWVTESRMAKKGEKVPQNPVCASPLSGCSEKADPGPPALIIRAGREADCSYGQGCPGMITLVPEGEAETPRPAASQRGTALTLGLILLTAEVFSIFDCISEQLYSPLVFDAGQIPA